MVDLRKMYDWYLIITPIPYKSIIWFLFKCMEKITLFPSSSFCSLEKTVHGLLGLTIIGSSSITMFQNWIEFWTRALFFGLLTPNNRLDISHCDLIRHHRLLLPAISLDSKLKASDSIVSPSKSQPFCTLPPIFFPICLFETSDQISFPPLTALFLFSDSAI